MFDLFREEHRYRQDLDRQGQNFLGTMHKEKDFGRRKEEGGGTRRPPGRGTGLGVQGIAPRPVVLIKCILLPVKFVTKSVP